MIGQPDDGLNLIRSGEQARGTQQVLADRNLSSAGMRRTARSGRLLSTGASWNTFSGPRRRANVSTSWLTSTCEPSSATCARAMRDLTGKLPQMPGVFPDRHRLSAMRRMACVSTTSPHWRTWLHLGPRCVVPFNYFCEYADTKPRKTPTWFALDDDRPLAVFAGIWTTWHGKRGPKANPVEGEHQLFGFLTTEANAEVRPIHPKAMPVILTSEEAVEQWLTLPVKEALALQKPPPDGALRIVATGEKEDSLAA
jgi:putative SOS response-associated peptidase YedK